MTNNELLGKAIQLIQAGKKAEAQKLLEPCLQTNPHDVKAWLWEARIWPSPATCLIHNPDHPQILTVLAALNTQRNRSTSIHMRCA